MQSNIYAVKINARQRFGFHPTMVKWIMACVSSASYSLSVNGNIHGFFKGRRGLRQGGPLSPYLFTLVMEVLTLILKRRVHLSDTFRFHNHCEELQIINVYFANDLFIFALGDAESVGVIMDSLDEFKRSSGLVPSIPKSTSYFCNVLSHVKLDILNIMPFSERELPVKYLGIPLISLRLLNKDYKIVVEKAKNRIDDWKNKSLSFAGRLQLSVVLENGLIPVPNLDPFIPDRVQWREPNGNLVEFSVLRTWEALRPRDLTQLWCPLCDTQMDTHAHLFFECPFSKKVWLYVRRLADMELVPPILNDIFLHLQPMSHKRTTRSIIGRLILAASSYFIWLERNNCLFKMIKRSPEEIHDVIMVTVRLKLISFRFKNTVMVNQLLSH
ncbi:hypothetical protein Tco_0313856 [Tanacetum coccineum]